MHRPGHSLSPTAHLAALAALLLLPFTAAQAALIQSYEWDNGVDFSGAMVLEFNADSGNASNIVSCSATGVYNGNDYDWGQCNSAFTSFGDYTIDPNDWSISHPDYSFGWDFAGSPQASLIVSGAGDASGTAIVNFTTTAVVGAPVPVHDIPAPAPIALLGLGLLAMTLRRKRA